MMTFRRRVKSPEVAETTFTMSTIEEEMEGVGAIIGFDIIIIVIIVTIIGFVIVIIVIVNRYDRSSKSPNIQHLK